MALSSTGGVEVERVSPLASARLAVDDGLTRLAKALGPRLVTAAAPGTAPPGLHGVNATSGPSGYRIPVAETARGGTESTQTSRWEMETGADLPGSTLCPTVLLNDVTTVVPVCLGTALVCVVTAAASSELICHWEATGVA